MRINTEITKFWSEIPDYWKKTRKYSQVDYKPSPSDKGLASILGIYASKDDLRPALTGYYFDDKNIVCTDAHRLFIIPNTSSEMGLFEIGKNSKIDAKYPDYRVVIPESYTRKYKINIQKLKTFCSSILNGQYCNKITKAVRLVVDKETSLGFNGQFLIDILDGFEKLGYSDIYMGNNDVKRASTFVTEEKYLDKASATYGKSPLGLLMPIMTEEPINISANDVDFNRELQVTYDLSSNSIIDSDGKKVSDWQPQTDWGISYWNEEEAKAVTKVIKSSERKYIPILENIKVENQQLTVSNLDITYVLNFVDVEDGIYDLVNMALVNRRGKEGFDDYPKVGSAIDNEFISSFKIDLPIGSVVEAEKYVSYDKTDREFTQGIHIKLDNGVQMIEATNMYMLFHSERSAYPFLEWDITLGSPELLVSCLKTFNNELSKIQYSGNYANIFTPDGRHSLYIRLIDDKYPDVSKVVFTEITNTLNLDARQLKDVLKLIPSKSKSSAIEFIFGENNKVKVILRDSGVKKELGIISGFKKDLKSHLPIPKNYIGIMIRYAPPNEPSFEGEVYTIKYLNTILETGIKYGGVENDYLVISREGNKSLHLVGLNGNFNDLVKKVQPIQLKEKKTIEKVVKSEKPDDESGQIKATIKALGYLAEAGDEDAKKTIKALKILLENM